MKKIKSILLKALSLLLCVLAMPELFQIPIYATESLESTSTTSDEVEMNSIVSTGDFIYYADDSTFTISNTCVDISDEYGDETAYISEVEKSIYEELANENETILYTDSEDPYPGDDMVFLTQKWLNQEYGDVEGFGSVPENGKTGWDTVYGLLRALQHELGITNLANSFGPTTSSLYSQNLLQRNDGVTNNKYAILQGALWCKGYNPGHVIHDNNGIISFEAVFDEKVESAIKQLKEDAGLLNPDGIVTLNVMKALMSMDSFKLLSSYGGTPEVREMQQKLNRKYESYTGLTPCDGVYGRNTNKALVFALQAEEGMPTSVANGSFGPTTQLCCPTIPYVKSSTAAKCYPGATNSSFYSHSQINSITELLQFALLVNGFGDGVIDGIFDSNTQQDIREFQKKYAIPVTGVADRTTWMSLFVSRGDTARTAIACDCATILTEAKARTLYDNGYRYVGRYLTGTYNGGISKAITRDEAQIIFNAGLRFFPIYQTSNNYEGYFTPEKGLSDARAAINAAQSLGVPKGTIIYFAVDFDAMDYQITASVLPYFQKVAEEMSTSSYKVGVYGPRNVCSRVSNEGYACSSFVGDMSTGFSGNLGFTIPDNWAFDQFATISLGQSGHDEYIEIDKNGFSGRDHGVSALDEINPVVPDDIEIVTGSSDTETVHGPTVNILGQEIPLFSFDVGFNIDTDKGDFEMMYNQDDNTISIVLGMDVYNQSTEVSGTTQKVGKFNQAYTEVKTTLSYLGKNEKEFTNRFKNLKKNLIKSGGKIGFDCDTYFMGYITINCATGLIEESGAAFVGEFDYSVSYPIYSCIYAKFGIGGTLQTSLIFNMEEVGEINTEGLIEFSVSPSFSVGVDVLVASAYAGVEGELGCSLELPFQTLEDSFEAELSASFFFEYSALLWGEKYEWEFLSHKLYPVEENTTSITSLSIDKNNLKFIEPIDDNISAYSTYSNSNAIKENIQKYCNPKIISTGDSIFMVYIDDATNRTAENRTILMYSVYDKSTRRWSSPLPVLDDDTMDFEPAIYSDGIGGVHIVWQNANCAFDSNVTFEEMSTNMDLYYTHWTGTTFEDTFSITSNNSNYEMAHRLVASGDDISIIWEENSLNDPFALSGTNSINRRQFTNGSWQNYEVIVSGLSVITSIDTAYVSNNNIIAYSAKTETNGSNINDLEIFLYDGTQTIRVTSNELPDYSISIIDNEIYWISGESIVSISLVDESSVITVVESLGDNVSKFKIISNVNGNKAIIWLQETETSTIFWGVNYNISNHSFGNPEQFVSEDGIILTWDICMLPNGMIETVYSSAEKLSTQIDGKPYGRIDLVSRRIKRYCDVYVEPSASYYSMTADNEKFISVDVTNVSSIPVKRFNVTIYDENHELVDTKLVDKKLDVGESTKLDIPFTLDSITSLAEYTVEIAPVGVLLGDIDDDGTIDAVDVLLFRKYLAGTITEIEVEVADINFDGMINDSDISLLREMMVDNNAVVDDNCFEYNKAATFTVGHADLFVESVEELRTPTARRSVITVKNNGDSNTGVSTIKITKDIIGGEVLLTQSVPDLQTGESYVIYYDMDNSDLDANDNEAARVFYISLECDKLESNTSNNTKKVLVYPDYNVNVSSSVGGTATASGIYEKGTLLTLTAVPNDGYIFDGWYENGNLLHLVEEEYSITVDCNRNLEARFKPNDLEIAEFEIFGSHVVGEEISLITTVVGGIQPLQWTFCIELNDVIVYYNDSLSLGFIEWTPEELGTYNISVIVSDATGVTDTYSCEITIT